jgi:hypothetical protein
MDAWRVRRTQPWARARGGLQDLECRPACGRCWRTLHLLVQLLDGSQVLGQIAGGGGALWRCGQHALNEGCHRQRRQLWRAVRGSGRHPACMRWRGCVARRWRRPCGCGARACAGRLSSKEGVRGCGAHSLRVAVRSAWLLLQQPPPASQARADRPCKHVADSTVAIAGRTCGAIAAAVEWRSSCHSLASGGAIRRRCGRLQWPPECPFANSLYPELALWASVGVRSVTLK